MRATGINETAPSLRYTMATDLMRGGANVRGIQQALGHARLDSRQTYLGLWGVVELRKAMGGRWYGEPKSEEEEGS